MICSTTSNILGQDALRVYLVLELSAEGSTRLLGESGTITATMQCVCGDAGAENALGRGKGQCEHLRVTDLCYSGH